jgi:phytanoyl-CoA hydroxylase
VNKLPTYAAPEGGKLTERMRADYERAGVLVLEGEVRHIFSALDQTQLGDKYFEESGDKVRFFFEQGAFDEQGNLRQSKEQSLNKMGHAMHDLDPVFDAFSRTPELGQVAQDIGIADPGIIQSMVIFKPPRIGGEVHCHQDSTYIYTEPESCVGFWFALEDATVENGCMQFIPGGHRMGLKERELRGADGKLRLETLDTSPWPEGAEVAAEAGTGTLVIFDGRSPHLSGPNHSDKSRCAYTLHVVDRNCHYPKENWLPTSFVPSATAMS